MKQTFSDEQINNLKNTIDELKQHAVGCVKTIISSDDIEKHHEALDALAEISQALLSSRKALDTAFLMNSIANKCFNKNEK